MTKTLARTLTTMSLALLLLAATPSTARATIFEVWGQALAGGGYGNGKTGRDFYSWAGGGGIGVEVGVKLWFIGAYVDYTRFFGGKTGANLLGFNVGGDGAIKLSSGWRLVLRLAGTFYLGTLDNAVKDYDGVQVSSQNVDTRGFGVRGGIGLRYVFARVFSIGTTPQIGYHYFFGGADDDVTKTAEHSHGWDFQLMAYFRVGLGF